MAIRREEQRAKRRRTFVEKDLQAREAGVPLRVLEMDNYFDLKKEQYVNWPQPITKDIANNALMEFRKNTMCDSLEELPCVVCSEMFSSEHWSVVPVKKINLSLLKIDKKFEKLFFDVNFNYGHLCIDKSGHKILLDMNGFVKQNMPGSKDPFNLRICVNCKRSLDIGKTPLLSLANVWIGPVSLCLQRLTIPEQLLISTGYLCINLIQLTNQQHTHHKLKGHVITFTQNPVSLTTVLPLPMYHLCDNLKVVFVGQGQLSEAQLKKILRVRKSKVIDALNWLINHNILYKKVRIDGIALNSLPEDEILMALMATTVIVDTDPKEIEHYTGYVTDLIDDNNMNDLENDELNISSEQFDNTKHNFTNNEEELRNSGMACADISFSEKNCTLKLLEKMIEESDAVKNNYSKTILMLHSNYPQNEYTDLILLPAAFFVLFPYDIGGHEDKFRKQYISFKQYTNHLLCLHDPRFRQH
ncbi:24359_t:CDS:1 [Cetraspora pellucida]|uniref:24359_t:CDS:1 n=1 Tax=Cetraspora pellucida TaxID=1433469 RepID=A0A9N9AF85_9GLOM|nr:24359_t:CDS:1 [Cetraspora pellucida]